MKTKIDSRSILFRVAAIGLTLAAAAPALASTLITFDDLGVPPLTDVTSQYASRGVSFQGFDDGGNPVNVDTADDTVYNDVNPSSPPTALSNFYNQNPNQRAHILRILFSTPQNHIRLKFNGAGSLGANAAFNVYSPTGVLLDTLTVPAATDSTMHPLTVPDANVGYLDIVAPQSGWGFYIDDVQFGPPTVTFDDIGLSALDTVTAQYASRGVIFEGFTDAGCLVNLDGADNTVYNDVSPSSLPFALANFYNKDKTQRAHIIRLSFQSPASYISLMFNGAGSLGATAAFNVYSPAGVLLDTLTVPAATDSTMHPLTVPDANVGRIDIVSPQTGWGFYIDDLDFQLNWPPPVDLITFDDVGLSTLADVTTQYASRDVVFQGFDDLGNQVNLAAADNTVYPDVNPASSPFALSSFYNNDKTLRAHIMRLLFSTPVNHLSLMFNGAGALGANAAFNVYSPAGVLLDTFTVPAATDSTMHPVTVPDVNVGYLDIVAPQTGWGFYIDNVQFALTPLQVTSSIAQAVAISWSSVSGGLYQVLWKSPLTGSAWAPLGSPVVGTGGTMTAFDVITGGSRFYHVERVGVAYDTKLLTVVGAAPLIVKPTNSGTAPEVTAQPAPASAAKVSTVVGAAPAGAKPTNEGSAPGDNAQPVPGKETNSQHPSSSKSTSTRSVQKADSN